MNKQIFFRPKILFRIDQNSLKGEHTLQFGRFAKLVN